MEPSRQNRSRATWILRALLLTPIPLTDTRLIDIVIWPVAITIAIVVCLPILAGALLAGAVVGLALQAVGAPEALTTLPGLIGFVGGLAVCFVALLRIYRRFPARIRSWVTPEDDDPGPGAGELPFRRDPAADRATLLERVAAADAALAPDDTAPVDR